MFRTILKKYNLHRLMGLAVLVCLLPNLTSAATPQLLLPNIPIGVSALAEPNVVLTLDDSGSMNWTITPDALRSNLSSNSVFPDANTTSWNYVLEFATSSDVVRGRSASQNGTYYDPTVTYTPWANSDGKTTMAAAPVNCAPYYVLKPTSGCVDFTVQNTRSLDNGTRTFWPATYFNYNGGSVTSTASYTRVEVKPTVTSYTVPGGVIRADCSLESSPGAGAGTACTYNEELQNFANWFSYYRARILMAKAGVGKAFSQQKSDIRVGYATLNSAPSSVDGVNNGSMVLGVRHFADPDRQNFFDTFYKQTANSRTPLRQTLKNVARYYQRKDNRGPWGAKPGFDDTSPHAICRQNYHILTTDGFWNGSSPNIGEQDGAKVLVVHTSSKYPTWSYKNPIAPYKDSTADTLADTAFYYWYNDLRTDLDDFVTPVPGDEAYWQHMVNYTVGLGIQGQLTYPDDWSGIKDGSISWPATKSGSLTTVDDLWHAAVNSRGLFFSAKNPTEFSAALSDALFDIRSKLGSVSDVSVDSFEVGSTLNVFSSNYVSGKWVGELTSRPIDFLTGAQGAITWQASDMLGKQNFDTGRNISTFDPAAGNGVPFRWASLTGGQQADLDTNPDTGLNDGLGADRLDYVRGKPAVKGFRKRPNGILLGDIVNSSPVYVGPPDENYPEVWDGPETSFKAFRLGMQKRDEMVYVGANDGMLHAFDAATGNERFAYVPNAVIPNLNKLTSSTYGGNHRFFVDGKIKVQSAFFSATAPAGWRTVLVGALRVGGKAVYAMDVTDPVITTEADVPKKVLWEFTDGAGGVPGADMGYVYGDIAVVRMNNGEWAAVFGNGYNSQSGHAALYIVNIEDGTLIRKIDMGAPVATEANGLASPLVADINGDSVADLIYAGDLQGNVWKVDVRDKDPLNWDLMYGATPLFVAKDASGNRLPITARVEVGRHPTEPGFMVYIGTGKYLEAGDQSRLNQKTQAVFAVWDKDEATLTPFDRSHLLEQEIYYQQFTGGSTIEGRTFTNRSITWYTGSGLPPAGQHLGWFLDLVYKGGVPVNNQGERIIHNMILRPGRILFTSLEPPIDPCDPSAGTGWIYQFDAYDGSRLEYSVWDMNEDTITGESGASDQDRLDDGTGALETISAVRVGKPGNPALIAPPGSTSCVAVLGTATGGVQTMTIPCDTAAQGRQSWIRIQ